MTLYRWSQIAAAAATADSSINWQEGQAPSSINDSGRAMMAATAKYRDDISGAIVTGGTSTAYTVTSCQIFSSLPAMGNQMIAFTPHTTNGATVTLNIVGLGAKPLRSAPGVELVAGTLIQGSPYAAVYNNGDAVFYLHGFYVNPYNIPIGAALPFFGMTAPNSSFVLPFGQAISRNTYATLFSMFSTTYGSGDGSSTFNLPDLRGRIPTGKHDMGGADASPTRLTTGFFGANPATLGAVGGNQAQALITANLPPYTPSGSVTNVQVDSNVSSVQLNTAGTVSFNPPGGSTSIPITNTTTVHSAGSGTFTGTAQGGSSSSFSIVQPALIVNYLLRII